MRYRKIKIGGDLYNILDFTLNELVYSLEETKPRINRHIEVPGIYVPELPKIWYNPLLMETVEDLHLTVLHEISHHLDLRDRLSDSIDLPLNEAEMSAEHAYSKENIFRLMFFRYARIADKYGLK
jgi:hypothetical protein